MIRSVIEETVIFFVLCFVGKLAVFINPLAISSICVPCLSDPVRQYRMSWKRKQRKMTILTHFGMCPGAHL